MKKYENGRWVTTVDTMDESDVVNGATGNVSDGSTTTSVGGDTSSESDYLEESYDILEGQLDVRTADMKIKCRGAVQLQGLGSVLSSTYYVSGVKITLNSATMKQVLTLHKDSLSDSGISEAPEVETKRVEPVATQSSTKTYTVKGGDSLSKIAHNNLGSASRWNEVYALNKDTIGSNPNKIIAGQSLVLPA